MKRYVCLNMNREDTFIQLQSNAKKKPGRQGCPYLLKKFPLWTTIGLYHDSIIMTLCSPGLPLTQNGDAELNTLRKSMVHEAQNGNVRLRIQHARNYAVSQAQQDGCTGNFKSIILFL
ncbi:uncharacterized protein LOC121804740 [Salvia splendens]|uniref:uncharacterized protein LOC121804740 n=1 Tax=Salvia splendens TaxID=180675 RepID=UPI001C26E8B6|nr:uncharacterized protein LOC121804740 [Salvia splendens]